MANPKRPLRIDYVVEMRAGPEAGWVRRCRPEHPHVNVFDEEEAGFLLAHTREEMGKQWEVRAVRQTHTITRSIMKW